MPKIIILRGNSGSGKSTIAKALQQKIGRGTFLISQDHVRREMLLLRDRPNNQAIGLLENLIEYGFHHCEITILDGILYTEIYDRLFERIKELFVDNIFAYYFDISFEETLNRHSQKPNANEFGEIELRNWWRTNDLISNIDEKIITQDASITETVERIYNNINEQHNEQSPNMTAKQETEL